MHALLVVLALGFAQPPEATPRVEVTVDTRETPELAEWGQQAKELIEKWHPRIAELLKSDGFVPPTKIKLLFRKDMKGVAFASGTTITVAGDWVKRHPDDFGMIVHELTHVIQAYPGGTRPSWLVEGIADYVRFFHYEPQAKLGRVDAAKQSYRDGYRTSALFLAWLERTYDPQLVRKLNRALRRREYREEMFEQATGRGLDRLWQDFGGSAAARGRAAGPPAPMQK